MTVQSRPTADGPAEIVVASGRRCGYMYEADRAWIDGLTLRARARRVKDVTAGGRDVRRAYGETGDHAWPLRSVHVRWRVTA